VARHSARSFSPHFCWQAVLSLRHDAVQVGSARTGPAASATNSSSTRIIEA
jgi:hypothetical protein